MNEFFKPNTVYGIKPFQQTSVIRYNLKQFSKQSDYKVPSAVHIALHIALPK